MPKNREFAVQFCSRCGLSENDYLGIIKASEGLTLNDCYWVVEHGFQGKFKEYNFYENRFDRNLSEIAFTGYGNRTNRDFIPSPEFTINETLRKAWRRFNKKIYLYKGGILEPYSEFYAAQIADRMDIQHVSYGLSQWKDTLCSTCELFTDINTSFVPIYKFLRNCNLLTIADFLKSLGSHFYDDFADMIVFDALICNTDRHYGNFGLLVNNKTNKPIKFAPIFDSGQSLFNCATENDLLNLNEYAKTRFPACCNVTFDELLKNFMTDRQIEKLRKMKNFKFIKHSKYSLPSNRLEKIEEYLQNRVESF
ncbi:MAG: XRE family transcriptional regulator [Ruminococcus flavefaciens]|nr:XRE family transcriptional regulator [Ruminococcus flavefaciens]